MSIRLQAYSILAEFIKDVADNFELNLIESLIVFSLSFKSFANKPIEYLDLLKTIRLQNKRSILWKEKEEIYFSVFLIEIILFINDGFRNKKKKAVRLINKWILVKYKISMLTKVVYPTISEVILAIEISKTYGNPCDMY